MKSLGVVCPLVITIHDARGCVDVCFAHAKWRMETSMAFGHGSKCKHPEAR